MLEASMTLVLLLCLLLGPSQLFDMIFNMLFGRIADKLVRREWFKIVKRQVRAQRRAFWKYQTFHTAKWFSMD